MHFSRARYVTLCQQSLVTAAVLVVGLSAAGIKTLDIVPAPEPLTQANGALPPAAAPQLLAGHNGAPEPAKSEVDATPVTPKVREVKIASRTATPARTSTPQARVAPRTPRRCWWTTSRWSRCPPRRR